MHTPVIVVMLLSTLLCACGQTGPLYLPGEEPTRESVRTPLPGQPASGSNETAQD